MGYFMHSFTHSCRNWFYQLGIRQIKHNPSSRSSVCACIQERERESVQERWERRKEGRRGQKKNYSTKKYSSVQDDSEWDRWLHWDCVFFIERYLYFKFYLIIANTMQVLFLGMSMWGGLERMNIKIAVACFSQRSLPLCLLYHMLSWNFDIVPSRGRA